MGRRWEQSPTLMAASAQNSSSGQETSLLDIPFEFASYYSLAKVFANTFSLSY